MDNTEGPAIKKVSTIQPEIEYFKAGLNGSRVVKKS